MSYELKEITGMFKVYHELESSAKDFLFLSASALKNKDHAAKSAAKTLEAIKNYQKLPIEVRKELEKDKNTAVSSIAQLESLCKKALA